MKKALLLLLSVGLAFGTATAQSSSGSGILKSSQTHVPTDTVVNTAVKNQSLPISVVNNAVSVQSVITKISGTVAGVVRLYGSLDGINYVRVLPGDSLVASNVAVQSKVFVVTFPAYSYYRIGYAGTGTMSAKLNSIAVWRKE